MSVGYGAEVIQAGLLDDTQPLRPLQQPQPSTMGRYNTALQATLTGDFGSTQTSPARDLSW
ncbi:hypothetical protein [Amycolatopsis sp. NBC_00438]|uniref:hypothetical protein n=1 Tax=Amycolatopsis sp. NBC_00438 TaxID=2903558 RepID=UPI002E1D0E72